MERRRALVRDTWILELHGSHFPELLTARFVHEAVLVVGLVGVVDQSFHFCLPETVTVLRRVPNG
jgi:hypothetical protein